MRRSVEIKLSGAERSELERLARGRKVWRALSDGAHIVLLAAEGLTNVQIANTLGINNLTARKWRNRFAEHGMDGLQDEPRPGRPRHIDDDAVAEVVRKTCVDAPFDASIFFGRLSACGQVLSCVRPLNAARHTPRALMEMRGPGPYRLRELESSAS